MDDRKMIMDGNRCEKCVEFSRGVSMVEYTKLDKDGKVVFSHYDKATINGTDEGPRCTYCDTLHEWNEEGNFVPIENKEKNNDNI